MNPAENKLKCRGTHIVDLDGDWARHTADIPDGGIPLGTVKVRDREGALVRTETPDAEGNAEGNARRHKEPGIRYLMITNEGFFFILNHRKVRAALHQAGKTEPSDPLANERLRVV
jgi:hypothetical protein